MWVALIKLTSFLGRLAAFSFAVISLALISLTLTQRDWMDGISIYIVVMGVISIPASLVPPYPNFVYDAFFAVAWAICAVFSFLIMFLKSTCYGVANVTPGDNITSCPKYRALVAMCFLEFGAWAGCGALGLLLFLIAIFKNARLKSHHNLIQPTLYREPKRETEEHTDSLQFPPVPAPVHVDEKTAPIDEINPFPNEKASYPDEKRSFTDEKKLYPAPYPAEDAGESHRASAVAAETADAEEDIWAPDPPEYMKVNGLFAGFILDHWVALGFLGVVAVAVILPLLVIYAVPAFAVYVGNNIEVPDSVYGSITSFKDGYATFDVHSGIKAPAGISATLYPMEVMLFNPDTLPNPIPIAWVETTKIHIHGGQTLNVLNQSVRVANLSEWGRLWRRFAFLPEPDIGAKAKITVKSGPIKTSVHVVKTKSFQGLLNATQVQLASLILQPPDEDGANVVAVVPVDNPTPLSVDSDAKLTANLFLGHTLLGSAFVDGFKLIKGKGNVTAKGQLNLNDIGGLLRNITQVIGTELPFLTRGMAVATVQAESISDGGETYPYWTAAAQAVKLSAAVKIFPILGGLIGDIVGGALKGNGGALISLQPDQKINVNVTAINKVLRNLTIYDAIALGYQE